MALRLRARTEVVGHGPGSDLRLIGPPLRLRPDHQADAVLSSRNSAPPPSPELTDPRGHTFETDGKREPMRFEAAASKTPGYAAPQILGSVRTSGH